MHNDSYFHSITQGLNPEQIYAVTQPFSAHCLILAGAGCGKTSVLIRRIAFCANTFCKQHEIVALTFTHKAAEEMRSRLLTIEGIDTTKKIPTVTTFHGFGLKVLQETVNSIQNLKRVGYEKSPELLTSLHRLEIIAELTSQKQRKELNLDVLQIDALLEQYAVHKKKLEHLSSESKEFLRCLFSDFTRKKQEKNLWEFSDMIDKTIQLFSQYPDITDYYARHYKYILVDEFQDTNPLQITLLRYLLQERNTVFAVGDDDQAIYGFRGADIGPITNFKECFSGACIVKLETNYRSTPAILSAANRIFRDKPSEYRKILKAGKYSNSGKEQGRKPVKKSFNTTDEMIEWILFIIKSIHLKNRFTMQNAVLLFRLNETLDDVKKRMNTISGNENDLPQFLTVHGSKGLEFPIVFLCDLEESVFPHYKKRRAHQIHSWAELLKRIFKKGKAEQKSCDFDEEKRLFYVGVTRAEKYLYLVSVREKFLQGRKNILKRSRFWKII